uniref:57b3a8f0-aecc-469d-a7ee-1034d32b305b n=1 Tax=Plasmodiophora brassicae TaxID=37360 RepID=A0A3P3YWE7_PLABS|nr:57b3a8f0-aecc-469d-a7ee-1034d32b305b [Plasmodiophora brassicae]
MRKVVVLSRRLLNANFLAKKFILIRIMKKNLGNWNILVPREKKSIEIPKVVVSDFGYRLIKLYREGKVKENPLGSEKKLNRICGKILGWIVVWSERLIKLGNSWFSAKSICVLSANTLIGNSPDYMIRIVLKELGKIVLWLRYKEHQSYLYRFIFWLVAEIGGSDCLIKSMRTLLNCKMMYRVWHLPINGGCNSDGPFGHNDPVILRGKVIAQRIKGTLGITGLWPSRVLIGGVVWHLDVECNSLIIISWSWRRFQGFGCSPIKVEHELGLERRETVWSLSVIYVLKLKKFVSSTRGSIWIGRW